LGVRFQGLELLGGAWKISEGLRKSRRGLENLGETWKISEGLRKSRRGLENLGGA